MADQPTSPNDVTLRQMIDMMGSYPDDAVFRWFTVDADRTVCVTMRQARADLLELSVRRSVAVGNAGLIPKHKFVGTDSVWCEWCGFAQETLIEQESLHEPIRP